MQQADPAMPGLLDKKEGRKWHLVLNKRWHLLPPILSNEFGTGSLDKKRGKKVRCKVNHLEYSIAKWVY
jgi:hypothetical protein